MKNNFVSIRKLAIPAVLVAALAGCAGTSKQESTGELIDDSVITTKVKTALLTEENVPGTAISVTTFKGRVLLAGYVKSPDERQRAEGVARAVPGVKTVSNQIEIK